MATISFWVELGLTYGFFLFEKGNYLAPELRKRIEIDYYDSIILFSFVLKPQPTYIRNRINIKKKKIIIMFSFVRLDKYN